MEYVKNVSSKRANHKPKKETTCLRRQYGSSKESSWTFKKEIKAMTVAKN